MSTSQDVDVVMGLERELQTASCRRGPERMRALLAGGWCTTKAPCCLPRRPYLPAGCPARVWYVGGWTPIAEASARQTWPEVQRP